METNGISLFDQQPEEPKKGRRTAFLVGGLAALGVAGALGVGFVIGGRGGDGPRGAVDAVSVRPTQTVPVSPTAKPQTQIANAQPAGQAPAADSQNSQPTSNSGDTSGAGDGPADPPAPPAPTNTPVPPTSTPVPPTHTPVPPTHTPTSTPTATATPHVVPCPWCPIIDPLPFDPGIILHLDLTPPVFSSVDYVNCLFSHTVSFSVNEDSELWVTYDHNGIPQETGHGHGMGIGFNLGAGFFWDTYDNVTLHAVDNAGNAATFTPPAPLCF